MAKQKKSVAIRRKKPAHQRYMFYLSIVMGISIIGLTVYDYSQGESIFDHTYRGGVLSEQATPTPTFVPKAPSVR
jgi:hypothetical protein